MEYPLSLFVPLLLVNMWGVGLILLSNTYSDVCDNETREMFYIYTRGVGNPCSQPEIASCFKESMLGVVGWIVTMFGIIFTVSVLTLTVIQVHLVKHETLVDREWVDLEENV